MGRAQIQERGQSALLFGKRHSDPVFGEKAPISRFQITMAEQLMEMPLTPLEFSRRARRIYADREAVVDGKQRWSYAEFFERCDRWSSMLQGLGVAAGDRVA